MFARLLTRPLRYILAAIALAGCLLLFVNQSLTAVQAARQQITAGSTYVVNSTADTPDADILTPACADASGHCTLRAAIMQANFVTGLDTITLPSGVYLLTRPGNDDAAIVGDLDILDDVTIQGAGSGTTIVDGNGAVTGDRVFQILASAKNVTLSGLTIQHGRKEMDTYNAGGGLYWDGDGSQLHLHDVVVDGNIAAYGGGLYLNYSNSGDIVDMDQIVIHTNTITDFGGGLGVNFGDYATFDLRNSRVYSNAASVGGGLYFQDLPNISVHSVRVETTEIYSNVAGDDSGGLENQDISDAANPIMLLDSRLYNNHAGYDGGAITNVGTLVISNTTLSANHADRDGGAIVNVGTLVISNTTLSANSASFPGTNLANTRGGALYNYEGSQATINQSTLNGNSAASGGAIYTEYYSNTALTLINSTLSDNTASRVGGGIDAEGGRINLINSTVADNRVEVPNNSLERGIGGGVFITGTAIGVVQNALLADNIDHENHIHGSPPRADDCYDLSASRNLYASAQNLIEATSYCNIDGNTFGVISGQSPQLGPLQNNGGSTLTQAPLNGSPAIDQGDNAACPPTDQRGWHRPIGLSCDIGAVEVGPYVYLPLIIR